MKMLKVFVGLVILITAAPYVLGQEQSVRPGVNDMFLDPDVNDFLLKFEVESREIYAKRSQVVDACKIEPGSTVADIGAGTGLFTRLFSDAVGEKGRVFAVDISKKFLDYIARTNRRDGVKNVDTILCESDSTGLPPESVDLAFICDTYHHFEFPQKTMASLFRAMKPGGRVIVIDFIREEGKSSAWVMSHVRAGQSVFEEEISESGFKKEDQLDGIFSANYVLVFRKPADQRK